jgi:hypothetical protein
MTGSVRQRALWTLWTLLFAISLVAVVRLNRATAGLVPAGDSPTNDRHGFTLVESAKALGIDFTHQAPTFDARLEHIMPQVAAMGASVSVADFDRDGWQDLYVTNSGEGSQNRLYRNTGTGSFVDVAAAVGLADVNRIGTGVSMGSLWGDFDNDGYEDLFLYKYGKPELFRNNGGTTFVPVSARAGLPAWVNANAAVWLDFDRDGWLDLFLAGYWDERVDLWKLQTTRIMPESFEYAQNGGRKYLFRNNGDGTFDEVAEALGIRSRRWTLAVAAADLSGSGYPDLFLSNDYGVSELYVNDGGKRFVEQGLESGVGKTPKSGMNASFGDVFNDGRLSIYKTNISEPGALVQANDLWVPKHAPGRSTLAFDNMASALGIDLGGWSWGAQFGDLNNDGNLDLYLVNGYVSAGERTSYWYDFSEIAVGHSRIISDAANWPPMRGRSLSGYQRKRAWINDGAGRFVDVAQDVGARDTFDGRAVALVDLFNRGVLDVVVANQRGPLLVYRNTVAPGRHWIGVALEGTTSNRSAIGARVEVHWNGRRQVQEIHGGSGFSAENQRWLHYGLGGAAAVDRLVVRWPSGKVDTLDKPAVDRVHDLKETP